MTRTRLLLGAITLVLITSLLSLGYATWRSEARFARPPLEALAALLKEDQALLKELEAPAYQEGNATILGSYLIKIRRDGIGPHADMKLKLDTLAEDQAAIVVLARACETGASAPEFRTDTARYAKFASTWRDRWNSIMELFMAGGDLPVTAVPFPDSFPATVEAELAAHR